MRERLLEAAHALTEADGWAAVRMGRVAEAAGVSRQTVYNEFGTKHGLAEQLALRELGRFLEVVSDRLREADGAVEGIRSACEAVLLLGEESVLVRSVVGAGGGDDDFLMLLTTESGEIVEIATAAVRQALLDSHEVALDGERLTVSVEMVVRLVLSSMTRPSKAPAEAAADIAWLVGQVLDGGATCRP